jgi:hypothetical protein
MSFGTTERARWHNEAPLRRRFLVLSLPQSLWHSRIPQSEAAVMEALKAVPGWDADGRPVES